MSWDFDYLWHFLIGLVIVGLFVFGYLREKRQHGWQKLTLHQHLEASLWGIGGIVALAIGLVLIWLL